MHSIAKWWIAGWFVLLACGNSLHSAAAAVEPEDVLKGLRAGHPRVMVTPGDWDRIKTGIAADPELNQWHALLHAKALKMLGQPPVQYVLIGPRLLDKSRTALERITLLTALYRIDGETKFAERARAEMLDVCAFQDWHPPHFLDTAEMTNAVGLGYDWLYDFLTPEERETVRKAIVEKGLKEGLKVYDKHNWWSVAHHNWNQVCNGGMTVGALAVADEEPEIARKVIEDARASIPLALKTYGPDGGWPEGPGYWNYATTYTTYYLAALETSLGTDFGFKQIPGLAQTGVFEIDIAGPVGKSFNYADAGAGSQSSPALFWLAREFHQPVYAAQERRLVELAGGGWDWLNKGGDTPLKGHGSPAIFDLVWAALSTPADNAGDAQRARGIVELAPFKLPTDAFFRGINVAFFRTAWDDPKAIYVGFKGGDNQANHAHLDMGTFVLDAFGERWAADLGGDNYNLPNYFGKQRYTYYRLRTEGHNTLTFGTENQTIAAKAPIIAFESSPERSLAVADLTAAYKGKATHALRGIALLDGKRVLVQDEIEPTATGPVVWNFHTPAKIEIAADGTSAILSQGTAKLKATIIEPAGAKFVTVSANPPPPQGQQPDVTNLTVSVAVETGSAPVRIAVLFAAPDDATPVKLEPLAKWSAASVKPE